MDKYGKAETLRDWIECVHAENPEYRIFGMTPGEVLKQLIRTADTGGARAEAIEKAAGALLRRSSESVHGACGSFHYCNVCESGALDVTGHDSGCVAEAMREALALALPSRGKVEEARAEFIREVKAANRECDGWDTLGERAGDACDALLAAESEGE